MERSRQSTTEAGKACLMGEVAEQFLGGSTIGSVCFLWLVDVAEAVSSCGVRRLQPHSKVGFAADGCHQTPLKLRGVGSGSAGMAYYSRTLCRHPVTWRRRQLVPGDLKGKLDWLNGKVSWHKGASVNTVSFTNAGPDAMVVGSTGNGVLLGVGSTS